MRNKPHDGMIVEVCQMADDDMQALLDKLEHELYQLYPAMPKPSTLQPALTLIARDNSQPVGCVVLMVLDEDIAEIKRLFVVSAARGCGVAKKLMAVLEQWARQQGIKRILVETGNLQSPAMSLYQGLGYQAIAPFGPYIGNPVSCCFEKRLLPQQ